VSFWIDRESIFKSEVNRGFAKRLFICALPLTIPSANSESCSANWVRVLILKLVKLISSGDFVVSPAELIERLSP
jgi:hypothetical protein